VIILDANILLYAYDASSAHHQEAKHWLEDTFAKASPIGLTWTVILAFVRIATNPRAMQRPISRQDALRIVSAWLNQPQTVILNPTDAHWEHLEKMINSAQATGPLVMDAHLAALAVEHGATLVTTDRDFSRFPGLPLLDPLT
jgi:toxin-antitoxin system PIN domain toxin